MPPKSNKKEQQKSGWFKCDKCDKIIILNTHDNDSCSEFGIDKIGNFISPSINYSLPQEIEVKDVSSLYLQRFLFVPETICNFSNLTMNCFARIEINEKNYVKRVWVVNDKYLDKIQSNCSEIKSEQDECKSIKISKFIHQPRLTRKIIFKCKENMQDPKDIERLLRAKLKNTIIHPSNFVEVDFLNKKFKFHIQNVEAQNESDISELLNQMSINDCEYYFIQPDTTIEIVHSDKEEKVGNLKCSIDDIGGMDDIIRNIEKSIKNAIDDIDHVSNLKIPRGVLIHGLSGCGKSMLAEAIAGSYKNIKIESWKIFSKFYGESETNLRKLFDEAMQMYPTPCIIIIDEISNICPKNDSSDVVRKVSSLLISLLDSLHIKRNGSKVFVIATTNNLDNVDPGIRRSGRLDFEIEIPVPNSQIRELIVSKMVKSFEVSDLQIKDIAKRTHGFVGADLENLIQKSKRVEERIVKLTHEDIISNISSVKPSAMRELHIEKPNIKWTDIGGMEDLKLKLKQIVEWPLQHPQTFKRLGIKAPRGLLMFGPPGCSKTMIAKALATESNLNFISIKGSDLFSMWVGESEKAVRDLFVKARQLSPCIIFFDEIDAICGERESGSSVKERVLAQILTEIDGVTVLKNVIIIAATNRPDLIDRALMRPGRLDRIVYVQLPDAKTREEIFKIKLEKIPISEDVDIQELVRETDGYSGAEIEAVCKEAGLKALESSFEIDEISMKFFQMALKIITPRTSTDLLEIYNDYEKRK